MFDLDNVSYAFLISLLAGLSSLLGAALVFAFKGLPLKRLAWGLGFSAGIMVYMSFFELLPEAQASLHNKFFVSACFAAGLLIAYLLDISTHYFLDRGGDHDDNISLIEKTGVGADCNLIRDRKLMATGSFIALAIALHNFPEGIVTFTSALLNPYVGLAMALAVAIHNIPEGFCVALPIYCSTGSRLKGMLYALVAGIAEPVGAVIAYVALLGFAGGSVMGVMLATVAGIMFYVAVDELMPSAKRLGSGHLSIFGLICGMAFMFSVLWLMSLGS